MSNNSRKVVIADLNSRLSEIEKETIDKSFFLKVALFGKYLKENKFTSELISQLDQDESNQYEPNKTIVELFVKKWKLLATDLVKQASVAGIKDEPQDPYLRQVTHLTERLSSNTVFDYEDQLHYYFNPYRELIERFSIAGKSDLIAKTHLLDDKKTLLLQYEYDKTSQEWEKFKLLREHTVWWANYQVMRLTEGVLELNDPEKMFKPGSFIASLYRYEFDGLTNESQNVRFPGLLKRKEFSIWLHRLHEYLIPRLEDSPPEHVEISNSGEIENWLEQKDKLARQKIWQVVSALNLEWQLRDKDIFKLPKDKFLRARVKSQEDLEAVLGSLHDKKIIEISRKVGQTPPNRDPNIPQATLWITISDDPRIVSQDDTMVKVDPKKFSRLVEWLENRKNDEDKLKFDVTDPTSDQSRLSTVNLILDIQKGLIRYKGGTPVEVSPNDNKIKFLAFLLENKRIVQYTEIAEHLKINSYHPGVTNRDVAREVQFVRRDLAQLLKKEVGMTEDEINKMIIPKRNEGYKIHP